MTQNKNRFAVLGFPLGHSLSPAIHNPAFEALNIQAMYERHEIRPDNFEDEILRLKSEKWGGFNVTIPYKQRIIPFLNEIEEISARIGAVNTIEVRGDGTWKGYNTDYTGFLDPIRNDLDVLESCLVVGAGGAARAVVYGLLSVAAVKRLVITNRTMERAERLTSGLEQPQGVRVETCALDDLGGLDNSFNLLVNTTSVGMGEQSGDMPIDPRSLVHSGGIVYDLIYNPAETVLLKKAADAGFRTINGLPMLIGQAAAAFEIWTGRAFPEPVKTRLLNSDRLFGD